MKEGSILNKLKVPRYRARLVNGLMLVAFTLLSACSNVAVDPSAKGMALPPTPNTDDYKQFDPSATGNHLPGSSTPIPISTSTLVPTVVSTSVTPELPTEVPPTETPVPMSTVSPTRVPDFQGERYETCLPEEEKNNTEEDEEEKQKDEVFLYEENREEFDSFVVPENLNIVNGSANMIILNQGYSDEEWDKKINYILPYLELAYKDINVNFIPVSGSAGLEIRLGTKSGRSDYTQPYVDKDSAEELYEKFGHERATNYLVIAKTGTEEIGGRSKWYMREGGGIPISVAVMNGDKINLLYLAIHESGHMGGLNRYGYYIKDGYNRQIDWVDLFHGSTLVAENDLLAGGFGFLNAKFFEEHDPNKYKYSDTGMTCVESGQRVLLIGSTINVVTHEGELLELYGIMTDFYYDSDIIPLLEEGGGVFSPYTVDYLNRAIELGVED